MQRIGLLLLVVGLVGVALAYVLVLTGLPAAGAPWLLAAGASAVLAGVACLGAARPGRSARRLGFAIALAFIAVGAGLLLALALPAPTTDGALLLGLPRVTTILLLLTGLVPLLVLPIAYAIAFDDEVIAAADLERLRTVAKPDD